MNKTYITAVEAVSWIAFRDFYAISKLNDDDACKDKSVTQAVRNFLEALIAEQLEVRGVNQSILKHGRNGNLDIVPVAFLLREDIGFDPYCNKFDSLKIRDSYSLNIGEEEKRPIPWINLVVKTADVLKIWPIAEKVPVDDTVTEQEAIDYLLKLAKDNSGKLPARDSGKSGAYQHFQATGRRLFWKTYRDAHRHIRENPKKYNIQKPKVGRKNKSV